MADIEKEFGFCLKGLCLFIWVEPDGSSGLPGNDLCGLNDDSVSSGGKRKQESSRETDFLDCLPFTQWKWVEPDYPWIQIIFTIIIGLQKMQEPDSELSHLMLITFTVNTTYCTLSGGRRSTFTQLWEWNLNLKWNIFHFPLLDYPTCVLHSAPYRTRVSDHSGTRKDLFLLFKSKTLKQKLCVSKWNISSDTSRFPQAAHTPYLTHDTQEAARPQSSFKHEELNACTTEEEKIIELNRSHHFINLHADQSRRSIQAAARQQLGKSAG